MQKHLRVGTRPSPLAVKQAEEIKNLLPFVSFQMVAIETKGDKDKHTPLSEREETDFFTREIEDALLAGTIDVAIHSAKDMEKNSPEGLIIAAVTKSVSKLECLVSRNRKSLKDLPPKAVIGTSSVKRKEAILKFRSDLQIKDIRGNIDERLRQLDNGDFDAIIIAHAALLRLGYENRISQIIPENIIAGHPLQGQLVVQIRKDRQDLKEIFRGINELQ